MNRRNVSQHSRRNPRRGIRGRGLCRQVNESSQGDQLESHPTNSQRGRPYRRRGRGFSQRGHGQQHSNNKGYHDPQGTSKVHHFGRGGRSKKMNPQQQFLDFPFLEHRETVRLFPQFRVMFILRGLPGSGKSTIADAILQQYGNNAVVCSADYYRYNADGEYVWREDELQETHNKCQRRAEKFAARKKPVIIIDNTNVTQPEVQTYANLAKQYGYVVILVEPKTPWKFEPRKLAAKTVHNVSYLKICQKVGQFDEILPHYFGWFLSPAECVRLQTMAKDVLWKCLQVPEFSQCIKVFAGHGSPNFTVHDALSYYSIKRDDSPDFYHVTACFSPRGRNLADSPYHKSEAVEKALGKISQFSIIGCVVTRDTFSARVVLPTKEQQTLWMNDRERKRDVTRYSVEEMTRSFQRLPLADNSKSHRPDHCTHASAHITFGTRQGITPVQSRYDVQTVVNQELPSHVLEQRCEEYTLPGNIGTVKKCSGGIWAVYFNTAHVVPAIFSGYYD